MNKILKLLQGKILSQLLDKETGKLIEKEMVIRGDKHIAFVEPDKKSINMRGKSSYLTLIVEVTSSPFEILHGIFLFLKVKKETGRIKNAEKRDT